MAAICRETSRPLGMSCSFTSSLIAQTILVGFGFDTCLLVRLRLSIDTCHLQIHSKPYRLFIIIGKHVYIHTRMLTHGEQTTNAQTCLPVYERKYVRMRACFAYLFSVCVCICVHACVRTCMHVCEHPSY